MNFTYDQLTGRPAPQHRFDTFTVSDCNRDACTAARGVTAACGCTLALYGSSGFGKTHLLQAIHHALLAQSPAPTVLRMTAEDFVSYLIVGLHDGNEEDFLALCREADVLLLDDVQHLAGKQRTQEEFFALLDARHREGRATVITLDDPMMRQYFANALPQLTFAVLGEPDGAVRAGLLREKCTAMGLQLTEEETALIAERVPGDPRNLLNVLNRINLYRAFPEAFPDAPSVEEIVNELL